MFKSDTPITDFDQDVLGRENFAKKLANSINKWDGDESLVVGLYGEWGSGKSSVVNLALRELENTAKNNENPPIFFKFNPWMISEQSDLVQFFLKELAKKLKSSSITEEDELDRISKELITYSLYFDAVSIALSSSPNTDVQILSIVINIITKFSSKLGSFLAEYNKLKSSTLEQIKEKLDNHIRSIDRTLIVIIDDIDRLTDHEIKQVFQLIKLVANFPNTLYLVAFDKNVVDKALNDMQENGKYLEKIVQVPFSLPQPRKHKIEQILFKGLNESLASFDERNFDSVRWGNLYHGGLSPGFTTLRKIKRYLNAFSFTVSMISEETNPIDLIAIEYLRVFYSSVHEGIRNNKKMFVGYLYDRDDQEKNKKFFEDILSEVQDDEKKYIREILIQLFPNVEGVYKNNHSRDYEGEWIRQKRVCTDEKFDYYFILGLDDDEVSDKEIRRLVINADNQKYVEKVLKNWKQENRLSSFFSRMAEFIDLFDESNVMSFMPVYWTVLDDIDFLNSSLPFMSDGDRAVTLSFLIFRKITDREKRLFLIKESLKKTKGVSIPTQMISIMSPKDNKDETSRLVDDNKYGEITRIALKNIETAKTKGDLLSTSRFVYILYRWKEWGGDPSRYIQDTIKDIKRAKNLLSKFVWKSTSQQLDDYVGRHEMKVDEKSLEEFLDKSKVIDVLKKINNLTKKPDEKLRTLFEHYKID